MSPAPKAASTASITARHQVNPTAWPTSANMSPGLGRDPCRTRRVSVATVREHAANPPTPTPRLSGHAGSITQLGTSPFQATTSSGPNKSPAAATVDSSPRIAQAGSVSAGGLRQRRSGGFWVAHISHAAFKGVGRRLVGSGRSPGHPILQRPGRSCLRYHRPGRITRHSRVRTLLRGPASLRGG